MSGNDLFRDVDNELSTLMETVMNNYSGNNTNANVNRNRNDDPLSFTLNYPPQGNPNIVPPTTPMNDPGMNTHNAAQTSTLLNTQYYSVIMNSIQTIRDIIVGYNNNMRDYSQNISTIISLLRVLNVQHQHNVASERQNNRRAYSPRQPPEPPANTQRGPGLMNIGRTQRGTFYRTNSGNFTNDAPSRDNMIGIDLLLRALNMPTEYENVVVSPSEEQIDEATEIITYTSDMSDNYSTRCPITLEDFQEGQAIRRLSVCPADWDKRCGWLTPQPPVFNPRGARAQARGPIPSTDQQRLSVICRYARELGFARLAGLHLGMLSYL